jgi:membrane protein YqaA with SNARE-associated domain
LPASSPTNRNSKNRSLSEKTSLTHQFLKRSGRYRFIGQNLWKLVISIIVLGVVVGLVNHFLIDIDVLMEGLFSHFSIWGILTVFFASESFLGLLPPDLFIFWTATLSAPWLMIGLLALLSYGGGVVSFYLGRNLQRFPSISNWVHFKFRKQALTFNKFGGLLIFVAALTPLPFSPVSLIAGAVDYPFASYWKMALSRIIRFFLYGFLLLNIS